MDVPPIGDAGGFRRYPQEESMGAPAAAGESPVFSGLSNPGLERREHTHLAHGYRRVRPTIGQRHLTMRSVGGESRAGQ